LFLSSLVRFTGIPADAIRFLSVVIIAGFGLTLVLPAAQKKMELLFTKFSSIVPQNNKRQGMYGGVLIGLSLGLLWTPCVGPILASVISLAAIGEVGFSAVLITLAYSLGTAIPMFMIMMGGSTALRKVPWLTQNTQKIQMAFGFVMILTAVGIFFNLDRKFQSYILDRFPNYGVGLTQFEDTAEVRDQLDNLNPGENKQFLDQKEETDMNKKTKDLINRKIQSPELIQGGEWLNSEPLSMGDLKGKVVLIDFWTYSCINCQRTLPYLRDWWKKYEDSGLVIIGVHSPEFEFEKDLGNVQEAAKDFALEYPIMQDNDFRTWRAYNNRYWPAKYLIDKDGYIRYYHFGEGEYDETEEAIQLLLEEIGADVKDVEVKNPGYQTYSRTPETYLGYWRIDNFSSNEKLVKDNLTTYTVPSKIPNNGVAYEGNWLVEYQHANPQEGAKLLLNFESKEVFLVMRPKGDSSKVKVLVDGKEQFFGEDVDSGVVTVTSDTLYKIVKLEDPGRHLLELEFLDSETEVYAFTYG
jgi:thiol-disulfide isomerase/thioredoxin